MRFAYWRKGNSSKKAFSFWLNLLLALFLAVFGVLFLFTGSVQAVPTILPSILPAAQVGVSYSATLVAAPLTCPCTWAVVSGSLPSGLTLAAATGTISGTPTIAGIYTFFVTVTDTTGTSPQQGFAITVAAKPITFVYTYLPEATEGASYTGTIRVQGGKAPYAYSLVSGSLPSGLNLDPINGTISGIPTKGTAGTHIFTIGVTDSSTPPLSAQQTFSLTIKKGFYETVVTIASTLSAGETNVYVDGRQVAKLRGGQTHTLNFAVGMKPAISVDPLVSHPTKTDVRFKPEVEKIIVDELSPNATFNYFPEYFVDLKTDPPQITTLTGSTWYKEGSSLKTTAPAQIEGTTGTQYRFSYWLLPNGDKLKGEDLSWIVSASGKLTATYDMYYLLTVTSPYGTVDGGGWCRAGTTAKWSIKPPEVPMSGILGFFRGKLKPDNASGTEVMDAPKTVTVTWAPDYTMPALFISLLVLLLIGATFGVYRLLFPPPPKPIAPPLPPPVPAPPTIVVLEGTPKPTLQTTREQLLEQFSQLLQKYEDEVKTTMKTEELPEAKPVPEAQRLAPPKEEPPLTCSYTSKNLLRTVVGNWRKVEEKVAPPSPEEKAGEKGVSLVTVWARDIYNGWEVFTCTLPQGHGGKHEGTTSIAYSLQNTVTAEKTYTAKQKITPPKPHFTDKLPVVDVTHQQIIAIDAGMISDQVITPDEIVPPEEPSSKS